MNPVRKAVLGAVLVGSTLTGGAIGATMLGGSAGAATSSTTTPAATAPSTGSGTNQAPPAGARPDPSKGGHQANGVTETLLTGDTATKAKAAALAAVPGGTVERVETDAEGAKYEAHVKKADGSEVTVKLDASFKVTTIETGPSHP